MVCAKATAYFIEVDERDVNAICHHHAPAVLPFCLADLKLHVVTQFSEAILSRAWNYWRAGLEAVLM